MIPVLVSAYLVRYQDRRCSAKHLLKIRNITNDAKLGAEWIASPPSLSSFEGASTSGLSLRNWAVLKASFSTN